MKTFLTTLVVAVILLFSFLFSNLLNAEWIWKVGVGLSILSAILVPVVLSFVDNRNQRQIDEIMKDRSN